MGRTLFGKARRLAALVKMGLAAGLLAAPAAAQEKMKVLVLNKCGGFVHTSAINALTTTLQQMAAQKGFEVTVAQDASQFTLAYLRGFHVVVLNNTTSLGNVITGAQQTAFSQWMSEGGGVFGMHGALDHSDSWAWYTQNVAKTKFASHSGWNADPNAKVKVDAEALANPEYKDLLAGLPPAPTEWTWSDEWYSFSVNPRSNVDVLITIDEATFRPNPPMGDHPVTWAMKMPAGPTGRQGRFFFSARGHDTPAFADAQTRHVIYEGIRWASGLAATTSAAGRARPFPPALHAAASRVRAGVLEVDVAGSGAHAVEVTTPDGRRAASASGEGSRRHAFAGLRPGNLYLVRVTAGNDVRVVRAAF